MSAPPSEKREAGQATNPTDPTSDAQATGIGTNLIAIDQHTESIERAAVGALVLATDPIRAAILAATQDEDFAEARARFLVRTVRAMVGAGVPVDEITIAGYIDSHALLDQGAPRMGVRSFLHEIAASAPVPVSGTWYAALVVEAAARRRIAAAGAKLIRIGNAGVFADLGSMVGTELLAVLEILQRAGRAVSP